MHRYDYLDLRDRLFSYVPERAVIGCLLEHNADTKIVQSENEGLKQHQAASWVVEDDRFCYVPSRDEASLFIEKYIKMVMDDVGPENMETVIVSLRLRACLSLCGGAVLPGLPSPSPAVTPLPKGEALAKR